MHAVNVHTQVYFLLVHVKVVVQLMKCIRTGFFLSNFRLEPVFFTSCHFEMEYRVKPVYFVEIWKKQAAILRPLYGFKYVKRTWKVATGKATLYLLYPSSFFLTKYSTFVAKYKIACIGHV